MVKESAARESNDGEREKMIEELAKLDKKKKELADKLA